MTPPTVAGWTATLDQLDWVVDAAWTAIGCGDLERALHAIDGLEQSPMLPPLPAALGERATQVLDRLRRLEEWLAAAQRHVRMDLSITRRRATAPTAGLRTVPRFIDRRT